VLYNRCCKRAEKAEIISNTLYLRILSGSALKLQIDDFHTYVFESEIEENSNKIRGQ